jgi:hypothetical protein
VSCAATRPHSAATVLRLCHSQIDREGHVIDVAKSTSKLSIIEQEFKVAERLEQQRLREEAEMRVRADASRWAPCTSPRGVVASRDCDVQAVVLFAFCHGVNVPVVASVCSDECS